MPEERSHMPDANRLSVLVAAVLLAYALAHLIETQRYVFNFKVLGIAFPLPLNMNVAATFMATGLTAAGMDWLLRGHPHYEGKNTFQHWILPALTSFALGLPLYNLPFGPAWWLSFGLGGTLLLLVFLAEYIALDSADIRHPAASAGLVALSYALFLIVMATLSLTTARLVLIVIVTAPAAGLVSLRALHLRTGEWKIAWAIGIALILTQLATSLHYWPLEPVQYGLALLGPLYALTELALNLDEDVSPRRAAIEVSIGLAVFWAAAFLARG
ncbi:MAG: hypothetical protein NT121_25925 [Chloroflexi bacterium]|nr:hypothetical protein [Chloroflexota bacterium]